MIKPSVRPSGDFDRLTGVADGPITVTSYFEIPMRDSYVTCVQLHSPDATANSTYLLEGTNFLESELASTAVDVRWVALPITVTGPTSAASTLISFSNLGCRRVRLKVTFSSSTQLSMRTHYIAC